ncbi:MAG: GNAT family protein [Nanoarchaeota archaeon]
MKIETKRLILRPPKLSDWKDIVEGAGDVQVSKMTAAIPHPYSKKDADWWINDVLKKWKKKKKDNYTFMIELKEQNKLIGATDIHKIDFINKKANTGSWINRRYWRRGYILEAKIPVIDFIFNKLKLRRIETQAFVENKASNSMSKKLGFKFEGTKRKSIVCKATGKIHDENIYGLLKKEWEKIRSKLTKDLNKKIK